MTPTPGAIPQTSLHVHIRPELMTLECVLACPCQWQIMRKSLTGPSPSSRKPPKAQDTALRGFPCRERRRYFYTSTSSGSTRPLCREPCHYTQEEGEKKMSAAGSFNSAAGCQGRLMADEQRAHSIVGVSSSVVEIITQPDQLGAAFCHGHTREILIAPQVAFLCLHSSGDHVCSEATSPGESGSEQCSLPHFLKYTACVFSLGKLACTVVS